MDARTTLIHEESIVILGKPKYVLLIITSEPETSFDRKGSHLYSLLSEGPVHRLNRSESRRTGFRFGVDERENRQLTWSTPVHEVLPDSPAGEVFTNGPI